MKHSYHKQGRAVFLSVIMVLSMVAIGATFAAPAAAQQASVDDKTVGSTGQVDITIPGETGEAVRILGELDGWTIEDADPRPGIGVLPEIDSLPHTWDSSDDSDVWGNIEGGSWELTLSPPADAAEGDEYAFEVIVGETDDPVDEDSFEVTISDAGEDEDDDAPGEGGNQVDDLRVSTDGQADITVPGEDGEAVRISGSVDGWTIEDADPGPGLTVLPSLDELPATWDVAEDGETWANLEGGSWELTLSPPADAEDGDEYTFDVTIGEPADPVEEDSFTITIGDAEVPEWVEDEDTETTPEQFNAFDQDDDGELTDAEIREAISQYVVEGDLDGLGLSDDDVRQIVTEYIISN